MPTLSADNLDCRYGRRQALDACSLTAEAGEVLVVMGANGSGKTTLLRALSRSIRPHRGTVLLHERDIWSAPATDMAREIALMPQSERRDWPLTVEEAVSLGRLPHRGWLRPLSTADRATIQQSLEALALVDLRDRPITELSGGEWRRVILARALAQQAGVLLLDEPTNGLDLRFQVEVLRLVRQLAKQQGLSIVLTLHDLNLAAVHADRIALLARRTLLACGTPHEVLTPQRIAETFGIPVTVIPHPVYGTPLVVPLLEENDLVRDRP